MAESSPSERSFLSILKVLQRPKFFPIFVLGFSSGLPLFLTAGGSTIQAWLKDAQLDLATISRFALLGIPFSLKFLWAPFLDTRQAPGLGFLGRRRGWGIFFQILLMLALIALSFLNPSDQFLAFLSVTFLIAFFSASQDIVLDALRTELLEPEEVGLGGSIYLLGYRLALIVSGAVALGLADRWGWAKVYQLMAACVLPGIVTLVWISEPEIRTNAPLSELKSGISTFTLPFRDFFKRKGAMEILAFVMLYKLPTMMAVALTTVFLLELGFQKTEIAAVTKVGGVIATILGTFAGGALMVRLGLKRSLWTFGILQSFAGGLFALLAWSGKNTPLMTAVIFTDNFMMGMGSAAIVGFMMSVCSKQFTGTQFALLSSLTALTRVILTAPAGQLALWMGWPLFFLFTLILAVPGLLLLTRFPLWEEVQESSSHAQLGPMDRWVLAFFVLALIVISTDFVWPLLGLPALAIPLGGSLLLISAALWLGKEWLIEKSHSLNRKN